jgi:ABC-type branched-subunit amino acid transport system ATPase component
VSPLLEVRRLSKSFGGLRAVNDVSLDVKAGELVGLIGPNGAGKTTLFNLLTGHERPNGGQIFWRGQRADGLAPHVIARRGLARTFQNPMVFDHVSVADNLAIGGSARRTPPDPEMVHRLEALCGLGPFLEREPHGLPYGVKRRLGIALALVTEPVMLLLDEPAAGLSHDERLELRATLRGLWRDGLSLVIVEHDMELVMNLCQRVVVLHSGTLIHDGAPEAAQKDPEVARVYLGPAGAGGTPGP